MIDILPEHSARFVRGVGPSPDEILEEMEQYAEEEGFPTVGPAVGGWLQFLAELVGARRVFEFGSGYGYSAYWFARGLPEDGEVVLTEIHEEELEQAREYLDRGGHAGKARFEPGDAVETVEEYEGPFDVVLLDHEKQRYREAFEAVRGKLADGGIVIADNAMIAGPLEFEALLRAVEGGDVDPTTEQTRGVAEYLEAVAEDPTFETAVVPVGEGIAVSRKRE